MRLLPLILWFLALPSVVAAQEPKLPPASVPAVNPLISRIAFGSYSNQDDPLPILRTVLEWEPNLFIYLGDACSDFHFGMLDINWTGNPTITFHIHDMTGRGRVRKTVRLSDLKL